jgi:RNA polymerase-interacting CarD/CdnL/TRCF family regulator
MSTKENESPIGKKILSIAYGVGTISGIEKMQEGGDDFFVVEYGGKNIKNYLPVKENKKSRFLSNETEFSSTLNKLKTETIVKEFPSKKDRHNYFGAVLGDCTLNQIFIKIQEVRSLNDLVPNEKDKLGKLINVLEEEACAIYKMTTEESKDFISGFLTNA